MERPTEAPEEHGRRRAPFALVGSRPPGTPGPSTDGRVGSRSRRGPGSSPAGLEHPEAALALLRRVDAVLDEHAHLESALPAVLDALCRAGRWAAACGRTFRAEGTDEAAGAETWRVPDPAIRREALQRASGPA